MNPRAASLEARDSSAGALPGLDYAGHELAMQRRKAVSNIGISLRA